MHDWPSVRASLLRLLLCRRSRRVRRPRVGGLGIVALGVQGELRGALRPEAALANGACAPRLALPDALRLLGGGNHGDAQSIQARLAVNADRLTGSAPSRSRFRGER